MSVTTYEIGCNYRHPKLKNKVYFLSKSFFNPSANEVTVHIDNGGASVSIETHVPHPTPPNVIEGFGIKFTETESLDERYKFTKQLNISINGHLTNTEWALEHDYYIMVETIEGTFYLINVDFPSKMSFTYNLSNSQDQTDFVFTSNSNFPALKVNSVPWESFNTCKTYHVPGIDYLKLLEKGYTTIDKENGVVNLFNSQTFKNIDYLKNTISLQETYDGDIATTTISFEIPFDDYKTSWQYNLLEFKQNLYVAEVGNVNGNAIFAGFEHGLEPQYEINGSTSESESTSIKITLTEASNWGIFEYDSWSYYNVPEKKWIGVKSEYVCIAFGVAGYTLMQEVDKNGTPTGKYKCLESELDRYQRDYNIVETYVEPEPFPSARCSKSLARRFGTTYYTCIDGDKYEIITSEECFDGKNWEIVDSELGQMIESGSSWCDTPAQTRWNITNEWACSEVEEITYRWVESGTTCNNGNLCHKYVKEQSNDNGETWTPVSPEESSANTIIRQNCYDCGYRSSAITTYYCNNTDKYAEITTLESRDSGTTWITASTKTKLIERNSYDCGYRTDIVSGSPYCVDVDKYVDLYYRQSSNSGETWVTAFTSTELLEANSYDCGYIPPPENPKLVITLADPTLPKVKIDCNGWYDTLQSGQTKSYTGTCVAAELGECVSTIGDNAFMYFGSLSSVTIPNSVTRINSGAFFGCSSLTSIDIPSGVTYIGGNAFYWCLSLTSIEIPTGITNIEGSTFEECRSLTSINIPNGVTTIGGLAFNGCSGLTSVTIPNSVITIADEAFENCSSLPVENYIRYADTYAIEATDKTQTSYTFKNGTRFIGSSALTQCSGATNITIPNSVIYIGEYAFMNCKNLTGVTIPTGITDINISTFLGCTGLTGDIIIPDNINRIGGNAFAYCSGLTSVTIGTGITTISQYAFRSCSNLASITINAATPPHLDYRPFEYTSCPIYVPANSVTDYKAESTWSLYVDRIQAIP